MPFIESKRYAFQYPPARHGRCETADDFYTEPWQQEELYPHGNPYDTVDALAAGRRASDPTVKNPESILSPERLRLLRESYDEKWGKGSSTRSLPHIVFTKDDCK